MTNSATLLTTSVFLEVARGIKLAVLREMLKDLFVDACTKEEWKRVLPDHLRDRIVKITSDALKKEGIEEQVRQIVHDPKTLPL